jgi:transposase
MHTTTVGVDLAKNHIQVAVADERYRVQQRLRLTRARFEAFIAKHPRSLFVIEACGSSQPWARKLQEFGHEVRLLPAQYVRAYVRRNKTDAADAAALIEASRSPDIRPVAIKTIDQQQIMAIHRLREHCKRTRTAKINLLRGCLREFGIPIPKGVARGLEAMRETLAIADNGLPDALRALIDEELQQIGTLKQRELDLERQLRAFVRDDELVKRWLDVPGVGLLGASALRAAVGDVHRFPSGRHLASWLGITAREFSSGAQRRLGRISKRGDAYLRTLIVHGARSALEAAHRARKAGRPLHALQRWVLEVEARRGKNKATVALANKIARILWAMARYERRFDGNWAGHD